MVRIALTVSCGAGSYDNYLLSATVIELVGLVTLSAMLRRQGIQALLIYPRSSSSLVNPSPLSNNPGRTFPTPDPTLYLRRFGSKLDPPGRFRKHGLI